MKLNWIKRRMESNFFLVKISRKSLGRKKKIEFFSRKVECFCSISLLCKYIAVVCPPKFYCPDKVFITSKSSLWKQRGNWEEFGDRFSLLWPHVCDSCAVILRRTGTGCSLEWGSKLNSPSSVWGWLLTPLVGREGRGDILLLDLIDLLLIMKEKHYLPLQTRNTT